MASLNAPLSVADLVAQAGNYTYNAQIPLAAWLRTASTMQKEAQVYEAEGNDPQTYLLLYRHADLILQKLQSHPDRNNPDCKRALSAATATVRSDLKKMEGIAPRIKRRHEEYLERRRKRQDALSSLEGRSAKVWEQELDGLSLEEGREKRRSYGSRPTLDAQENKSLAARLAQREVQRRDAARRNVRQHGVSEEQEQERRTGGVWGSWQEELAQQKHGGDGDLSSQLQEVAKLQQNGYKASYSSHPAPQSASRYHYPTVPSKSGQDRLLHSHSRSSSREAAPARPPKEQIYRSSGMPLIPPPLPPKMLTPSRDTQFEHSIPPPVPGKFFDNSSLPPALPDKVLDERPPTPSHEFDNVTFKPAAYLENGDPLRSVVLPSQLRHVFLDVVSPNTKRNVESCGLLCGILKSNALFITRLLIPEQKGTSDTCEMLNEPEIFAYCDKEDLMVFGWIHTHPTQTCFLSSRDLHTHSAYQAMMPESVAIVCAPKMNDWGCFRLTDPPGKHAILNCPNPAVFHEHAEKNIYTRALNPGHVVEIPNAPLDLVDLRPGKRFS